MDLLEFKMSREIRGNRHVVEVWRNGLFVASIYPHEGKITVVSKYLGNVKRHGGFPPVAEITFRVGS